jgi:hypothetical protein
VEVPESFRRPPRDPKALRVALGGRVEESRKRVMDVVRILEEARARGVPLRLRACGGGPDENAFRERVGAAGLDDVEWCGVLTAQGIRDRIWAGSDVLLSTSQEEGLPYVPLDAMAHGVVVVTSRYDGHTGNPFLRDGETCSTFPVGDVDAAVSRLEELHRDHARLDRTADAAREALRRWPPAAWRAAVQETFERLLRREGLPTQERIARFEERHAYGRMDRWGVPPGVGELVRRALRRFPAWPDGWSEWPGTAFEPDAARAEGLGRRFREVERTRGRTPLPWGAVSGADVAREWTR